METVNLDLDSYSQDDEIQVQHLTWEKNMRLIFLMFGK